MALADGGLRVRCVADTEGDVWRLVLASKKRVKLLGISSLTAWPITLNASHAATVSGLAAKTEIPLGPCSLVSITGLIAFEATAAAAKQRLRFVLNLPLEGLPDGRDAAVMRSIISNQDGFLRYLALLLAGLGEDPFATGMEGGKGAWAHFNSSNGLGEMALLENLVRALAHEPDRLRNIQRVIERLRGSEDSTDVIPPEFLSLWSSFERVLREDP
jgi:hypothetical protein